MSLSVLVPVMELITMPTALVDVGCLATTIILDRD